MPSSPFAFWRCVTDWRILEVKAYDHFSDVVSAHPAGRALRQRRLVTRPGSALIIGGSEAHSAHLCRFGETHFAKTRSEVLGGTRKYPLDSDSNASRVNQRSVPKVGSLM